MSVQHTRGPASSDTAGQPAPESEGATRDLAAFRHELTAGTHDSTHRGFGSFYAGGRL